MPTVRQLEYLVAIADERHFRRAAERVNTTQPTLSGQLKTLEDRLGVPLVERSRSRVVLTPAGAEIVDIARRVLQDVREIRAIAAAHDEKLSGVVRLGVPSSIGPYLVPKIVPDLRREYPELKFYVREELSQKLPAALSSGMFDVIIAPLPIASPGLETIELYTEPFALVLPSQHPLARKANVTGADLKGLPLLLLGTWHPLHALVADYAKRHGAVISREFEGTSLDTLREMVSTGLGAALLPALYVRAQQLSKDRTVKVVPLGQKPLSRVVAMAWRQSSPRAQRFSELSTFVQGTIQKVIGPL